MSQPESILLRRFTHKMKYTHISVFKVSSYAYFTAMEVCVYLFPLYKSIFFLKKGKQLVMMLKNAKLCLIQ